MVFQSPARTIGTAWLLSAAMALSVACGGGGGGSSAATSAPVSVAPVMTSQPQSQTVTAGSSVTFTGSASGTPAPTLQWERSPDGAAWTAIPGATGPSHAFTAQASDDRAQFRLRATNSVGTATSSAALLTVNPLPVTPAFTLQPQAQTVTAGSSVTFTAAASGTPTPTLQWERSADGTAWTAVPAATGSSYAFTAQLADSGSRFRVKAANVAGTVPSDAALLTVAPVSVAPAFTFQPRPRTVVVGSSVTFTAAATGTPTPTYQWERSADGSTWGIIPSATSASYTFTPLASDSGARFRVKATNAAATLASGPVTLTVLATESTVVLRVVDTSAAWGQEARPGWPSASPVKDAAGYSLYDLEIGRDPGLNPTYVALYKFAGFNTLSGMTDAQFAAYKQTSTLRSTPVRASAYLDTTQVLDALKQAVSTVLQREQPTRFVLAYSGHGAPAVFFEGSLAKTDAKAFLAYLADAVNGCPLVLDFSTNCSTGYVESAIQWYESPTYLIASEKQVGGFSIDPNGPWLSYHHDTNYHTFWTASRTTAQVLDAIVAARQSFWGCGSASIIAGRVEQSLAVYDLTRFLDFMKLLAKDPALNVATLPGSYSSDIGCYVTRAGSPELRAAFELFRTRYASNRDLFTWPTDTRGFSMQDVAGLNSFLQGLR
jgi:hypothetical protein